ncbi:FecR family protein [Hyphococcus sp. DH-69]|uniref:FecR family protein n=1 Tax=Hyphococcus formosus TaxID=3143534 RepID=UPI00398ACD7A
MNDKNVVELPDNDLIEEEAALWVMRLEDDAMTTETRLDFGAWIKQSTRHRQAFERMSDMWDVADLLEEYNRIDPLKVESSGVPVAKKWIMASGAIAASLMVVISAFVFGLGPWAPSSQEDAFRTAIGEQRTIQLADGSIMILNTDTQVAVDIDRAARIIRLAKGEAHFEVAKEKHRPFQVHVDQGLVQAVGTAFTVRLRGEEVEVTVAEGVVELFTQDVNTAQAKEKKIDAEWRSLTALSMNESAVFDEKLARREKLDKSDVRKKLMWRDGFLAFSGEPLADVVAEMSRYTDLEISIADPELKLLPIAGSYEAGNIQGMFDSLERAFGIKAKRDEKGKIILSKDA